MPVQAGGATGPPNSRSGAGASPFAASSPLRSALPMRPSNAASRKRTSAFWGWTFTSTDSGGTSRNRNKAGAGSPFIRSRTAL